MNTPTWEMRDRLRLASDDESVVMYQKWRDLLFLHWEYPIEELQKLMPKGLHIDTHNNKAYVGIVPFFMHDIRPRFTPVIPFFSHMQELNLRTYIYDDRGIPGVWFFSLSANSWIAVELAKAFFYLPYRYVKMDAEKVGNKIYYTSYETKALEYVYQPKGVVKLAQAESLEYFLIERYILYASDEQNNLYRGKVHHSPYELQDVVVDKYDVNLFQIDGLQNPLSNPVHQLYSKGVDVNIYGIKKIIKI